MSKGKVLVVVGETGSGKTTWIKNKTLKFKQKKTYCYLRINTDWMDKQIVTFTNFELFLTTVNKETDIFCIIDEGFTCLPKKLNIKMDKPENIHNKLADFLVDSRKLNRLVVIVLHSLSQIPTEWLIPYIDYLVRFTTNDLIDVQARRFSSYPNIAQNLLKHPKLEKYKPIILKLR